MATTIKTFDFVRGQVQVTRHSMGAAHGVGYQINQFGPGDTGYLVLTVKEVAELAAFLASLDELTCEMLRDAVSWFAADAYPLSSDAPPGSHGRHLIEAADAFLELLPPEAK